MDKKLSAAAVVAVAATVVTGLATAGGAATRQQVAFTYAKNPANTTLTPLTSGSILADHGPTSWCCWTQKTIKEDGERLDVNNPLARFDGKRGTITWRERIVWRDLTNGYSIATGTWRIVHGTGAYAHLAGQGHIALINDSGDNTLTYRAVGLVAGG